MTRIVEPELLDELPPEDPRARRSRLDLRRINAWMGNHAIMADALQNAANGRAPGRIVELGSGDGDFLLRVARLVSGQKTPASDPADSGNRRAVAWNEVAVTLLDRQKVVTPQTLAAFASLGWRAEAAVADVFDWLQTASPAEVVVVNEVLHHFDDARLAGLLRLIAGRTRQFIAIEPRRAPWPWLCSRLLWAVNCNSVTRHDAAVSVRAGFSDSELSALWPDKTNWQLTERPAGTFSHLFVAQKIPGGTGVAPAVSGVAPETRPTK